MTVPPLERDRLNALGFTDPEVDCLYYLWDSAGVFYIFWGGVTLLQELERSPADAAEIRLHECDEELTVPFLEHRFTVHQAAVLLARPSSIAILNISNLQSGLAHPLLDQPVVPRQFIVDVLLVSVSRQDAEDWLTKWKQAKVGHPVEPGDTTRSVEESVALLIGLTDLPDVNCGGRGLDCP